MTDYLDLFDYYSHKSQHKSHSILAAAGTNHRLQNVIACQIVSLTDILCTVLKMSNEYLNEFLMSRYIKNSVRW